MRRLLSGKLMDEVAIERLRGFEKQALSMNPTISRIRAGRIQKLFCT